MLSDSRGNPIYFDDRKKTTPEELAQYEAEAAAAVAELKQRQAEYDATVNYTPEELDAVITGVIDRAREGEKEWKNKQAAKRKARRARSRQNQKREK